MTFLDSGSFSLKRLSEEWEVSGKGTAREFYNSSDHWEYLERYCDFIKKYEKSFDIYAGVDVIGEPELSWRNFLWMRRRGFNPTPTVHAHTDLKWIRRYMKKGCDLLCFGGMAGSFGEPEERWLEGAFDFISDERGFPRVKIHGFGINSVPQIIKFPWWSVDGSSWRFAARMGWIYIPPKKKGVWNYLTTPRSVDISFTKKTKREKKHYQNQSPIVKKQIHEWLEDIDVPLGDEKDAEQKGVQNNGDLRELANLHFYERMRKSLPEWPWPFLRMKRRGLL